MRTFFPVAGSPRFEIFEENHFQSPLSLGERAPKNPLSLGERAPKNPLSLGERAPKNPLSLWERARVRGFFAKRTLMSTLLPERMKSIILHSGRTFRINRIFRYEA